MTLDLDSDALRANPDLVRLNPELLAEAVEKPPKPSKYRNVRTVYAGREYQSAREAAHARDLDLLQRAGEIVAWFPQVRITLAAGIVYVADFVVILSDGTWRAEDVKSEATRKIPTYKLKKKLYHDKFGRDIQEV